MPHDVSVAVGGPVHGWLLERRSGALLTHTISPSGSLTAVSRMASPVRAGFDAVERAAGGAIIAGPSVADPKRIVSFAIDAAGRISPATATGLEVAGGVSAVRLVALPGGGAILSDAARTRVVWLDDDARAVAHEAWAKTASPATCIDGTPLRVAVPSTIPGQFATLQAAQGPGSCLTSDFAWTTAGELRWIGSTVRGPHTRAELGAIALEAPKAETSKSGAAATFQPAAAPSRATCPPDMVRVGEQLCVDRFESTLADADSGTYLSPDYPPTPKSLANTLGEWTARRELTGDIHARAMPLPLVSAWQRGSNPKIVAVNRAAIRPSGYVTGLGARVACEAAGKRLCKLEEWRTACRGEGVTLYPYGTSYVDGACNVNGDAHPAATLHGNASIGHLDPRLNRVEVGGRSLLRPTGSTPTCASHWEGDAIYDMVGNLDEWVDQKGGAFAGGFYARGTTSGCEALVDVHPAPYLDYSTGVRCCKEPE
jgi:hypothetical protein